jgi:hypothetical protein
VVFVIAAVVGVLVGWVGLMVWLGAGDDRPWPRELRILLTAYHAQLALGVVVMNMWEGMVIDVSDGDEPRWVVIATPGRERLWLDETSGGSSVQLLRYWRDEAIPVLMLQGRTSVIEVHGPSGVVRAHPARQRLGAGAA